VSENAQDVYLTFSLISISDGLLCEILIVTDHKQDATFARKI
jgi:hypothetical protein